MKTLLVTILGALVITLVFVAGGYTLYRIEVNFTVSVVVLGIAWMVSLWLMPVSLSNCYLYLSTYLL